MESKERQREVNNLKEKLQELESDKDERMKIEIKWEKVEEAREKEIEREVSKISSVFKEAAKKEMEGVTTQWKEIVSEKDRRITELERTGRRN